MGIHTLSLDKTLKQTHTESHGVTRHGNSFLQYEYTVLHWFSDHARRDRLERS